VVDSYRRKLPEFRRAIAAPGCIGVPTEALLGTSPAQYDQNVLLEYAYAVARTSAGRDRISILDWGGGFGFLSFVVAELFPELTVDFHVKDVASVARAARDQVTDVTFWDDDTCLDRQFDLVTACGSLQYEPAWAATIARFGAAGDLVFLNRLPVALTTSSFVTRQHAYGTSYVGWVIGRTELLTAAAHAGLQFEREFVEGWSASIPRAPAPDEHRGFLFRRAR